jgi:hypothetical protein
MMVTWVAFLVDRCGNDGRMEGADVQVGCGRRAIKRLNPMPTLSNAHGSALGDLSRLAFRRSVDDQDIHTVSPLVAGGLKLQSAYLVAGI